jgi:hypothetical protein
MPTEAKGLVTKLASIMGELGNVKKEGFNKAQNYRFVRESDVVAALVPLLAKNKVILHTSVVSHERSPLYTTQSGMTMWMTTVIVDGTWIDGESGETLPIASFVGTGADTGDKGVYKAMTGAEKYMLMKSFLISTGDDPESDEKVDKTAAVAEASAGPRIVRGKQAGVQRGGKSALATTAQITAISRTAGKMGLDAETAVPVIAKIVGSSPAEGQDLRTWLAGLTSEQASGIVLAMEGMATFSDDVEEHLGDGDPTVEVPDEESELLPIV